MKKGIFTKLFVVMLLFCYSSMNSIVSAQQIQSTDKFKKASRKVESSIRDNKQDSLAQGYYDLGEIYFQRREYEKSESFYQKSKDQYEKLHDAQGIAKSSRALARVQEKLNKTKDAIENYVDAQKESDKAGNSNSAYFNKNDVTRLSNPGSVEIQTNSLKKNMDLGKLTKDTTEILQSYDILSSNSNYTLTLPDTVVEAFKSAYSFTKNNPGQALKYNQLITDAYIKDKDFDKAIKTKIEILKEPFVQSSSQTKASEMTSLANIYIQKKDDSTAIRLLHESYAISMQHGHTLEARRCVETLDSIYQKSNQKQMSLLLYKDFLTQLPAVIDKDSSLIDNKIISETEERIKILESEKALKDDLIKEKNMINYWLIGSVVVLVAFLSIILYILKKLKQKNKKIALQSLRREMNPHFIFNSLNSINQFIANNNELEANQYLAKFSTLMRNVMENSKEDFVLFQKEIKLLENYLELEKSRFPDKFDFKISIDDSLYADEQLYIPGMLIQPHLENAIWHGLRYMDEKGFLQLSFTKTLDNMEIIIEDNGIGIAGSRINKTSNQQQHKGRGISNTNERIKILNELYAHYISCIVEDKPAPDHGVKVKITVPLIKNFQHED